MATERFQQLSVIREKIKLQVPVLFPDMTMVPFFLREIHTKNKKKLRRYENGNFVV